MFRQDTSCWHDVCFFVSYFPIVKQTRLASVIEYTRSKDPLMETAMSTDQTGISKQNSDPVAFGKHLADSESFKALFAEGMALVEEAAGYLDGSGREAAKDLPRAASLTYATESMRLTTRLMQLASWLLLQRAVNEGEMSSEQAGQEKNKVRLHGISSPMDGPGWGELPETLQDLIGSSVALQKRICHFDDVIYARNASAVPKAPAKNPVADQLGMLSRAFGAPRDQS